MERNSRTNYKINNKQIKRPQNTVVSKIRVSKIVFFTVLILAMSVIAFTMNYLVNAIAETKYSLGIVDNGETKENTDGNLLIKQNINSIDDTGNGMIIKTDVRNQKIKNTYTEVVLVIDNSNSMTTNSEGIKETATTIVNDLYTSMENDVKVAVATNSGVTCGLTTYANRNNVTNAINAVQNGDLNDFGNGLSNISSIFSGAQNTDFYCIYITDSTDDTSEELRLLQENNIKTIGVLSKFTNNIIGEPGRGNYGTVYMQSDIQEYTMSREILGVKDDVKAQITLTSEILQYFDLEILTQDVDVAITETGIEWNVGNISGNEIKSLEYRLTLKEKTEIPEQYVYTNLETFENIVTTYSVEGTEYNFTAQKENAPIFMIYETYQMTVNVVNKQNNNEVRYVEFSVIGTDESGQVVYNKNIMTDKDGNLIIDRLTALGKVKYTIKVLENQAGYNSEEQIQVDVNNDYHNNKQLEATATEDIECKVDKNARRINIVMPITVEKQAVKVVTGEDFTAILKSNGKVYTFGNKATGRLGYETDNTGISTEQKGVQKSSGTYLEEIEDIAAGKGHTVALSTDGTVWTWGDNQSGQLGNGTNENSIFATQVKINENEYLNGVVGISAGENFSVALKLDGTVWTWGMNVTGTQSSYAEQIVGIENAIKVSAGANFITILKSDGTVWSIGNNSKGQLGDKTNTNSTVPVQVQISDVRDIITGEDTVVILKKDATVWAYGDNSYGQLAVNNTTSYNYPVQMKINASTFITEAKYIGAIKDTIYVVTKNNKIYSSGLGTSGEIGNKANSNVRYLTEVKDTDNKTVDTLGLNIIGIVSSSPFGKTAYTINDKGYIYGWGSNINKGLGKESGNSYNYIVRLGENDVELNVRNEYIKIGDTLDINVLKPVIFNVFTDDAVKQEDWTWSSYNEDVATVDTNTGEVTGVGVGHTTITAYNEKLDLKAIAYINVYRNVEGAITVPQVKIGDGFTVILKEDGTVWSVGYNEYGQLGNGTTVNQNYLSQVKINENEYLTNIRKISVGYHHVIAMTVDGEVYGWGKNSEGHLGQNNTINLSYATKVKGASGEQGYLGNIADIAVGAEHSIAITKTGEVYVWGRNSWGQFGIGNKNGSSLPVKSNMKNAIRIVAEHNNTLVLRAEGTAWGVGRNDWGQLGIGNRNDQVEFQKIEENVIDITAGGNSLGIIKEDGKVWTAGWNNEGQLGLGDKTDRYVPTEVNLAISGEKIIEAKYIEFGVKNLIILDKQENKVYIAGANESGQASQGNKNNITGLTVMKNEQEEDFKNVILIGENMGYGLNTSVIDKDGIVYISGDNTYGQIGNLNNTSTTYLTKMGVDEVELNARNEYIKIGDTLDINVLKAEGFNVFIQDAPKQEEWAWSSWNEDVATVNNNGEVTGVGIGQTTIIGRNEKLGLEAKVYIKVYRNVEGAITIPQVEMGDGFTVILKEDGTVWSAGNNTYGQLGNGTTTNHNILAQVKINEDEYLTGVRKISVGYTHILAMTVNGEVYAWGTNETGQLGQNNTTNLSYATKVLDSTGTETLSNIMDIGAGWDSSMVLTKTGEVYSWGSGFQYRLGTGNYDDQHLPVKLNIRNVAYIERSQDLAPIFVRTNGDAYIIGENTFGELGIGNTIHQPLFNKIDKDIINAAKNSYYSNILTETGEVFATGLNNYGQLGLGDVINRTSWTKVTLPSKDDGSMIKVKDLSTGSSHSIILSDDGKVYVTGGNANGELSQGNTTRLLTYAPLKNSDGTITDDVIILGKGSSRFYADIINTQGSSRNLAVIREDGSVWISGDNTYGQIGNGTNDSTTYLTPVGTVKLNVRNEYIKIGDTLDVNINSEIFNVFIDAESKQEEWTWSSSNEDVATIDNDGIVTGVGIGHTTITAYNEKLGLKALANINVYRNKEGDITVPQVGLGAFHTTVLKADGTVWCVGSNSRGRLGNGATENSAEPVQVKITQNTYLENVIKIATGNAFNIALTKDGQVYVWGANYEGQLGQGNEIDSCYAIKVKAPNGQQGYLGDITDIVDIIAGRESGGVITRTGEVYMWGLNNYGQLGIGNATNQLLPVKVNINNVINASMGSYYSTVLKGDGTVWTTGRNTEGQLGIGNNSNQTTFQKIADNVVDVSANGYSTSILKSDGTVWTAGLNNEGQLGLGDKTNRNVLTQVNLQISEDKKINPKYISMGDTHFSILDKDDNKTYIVGANHYGELSQGNIVSSTKFITMKTSEGVDFENVLILVEGGDYYTGESIYYNTALIDKEGYVYVAGRNDYGQIGNGTVQNSTYLTRMGNPFLDISEKTVNLKPQETKQIEKDMFKYVGTMNVFETSNLEVGDITYEVENSEIATITAEGLITGLKNGVTIITAKDSKTNMTTEIFVKISEGEPEIDAGNRFTIGVKTNGTVWTFGENKYGNLGIGNTTYQNFPEQVIGAKVYTQTNNIVKEEIEKTEVNEETGEEETVIEEVEKTETKITEEIESEYLENIEQASTGYYHTIALSKEGEVYTWGYNGHGELGTGTTTNETRPVRITGRKEVTIKDGQIVEEKNTLDFGKVIKVDAWQYMTSVLNEAGEVYVWGHGYGVNPVKLETNGKVIDISGKLILTEDRKVYNIGNLKQPILGMSNIIKISAGYNHNLALASNGEVYAWGYNNYGQLGNGSNTNSVNTPVKVLNAEGTESIKGIFDISAGGYYSVILNTKGEVYTFGYNGNYRLGQGTTNTNKPIKVESLSNIELIAASEGGHTVASNYEGFVYTAGLNDAGQLGLEDYVTRSTFEQVGATIIETDLKVIKVKVGEEKEIGISLNNTFNLKTDIVDKDNIEIEIIDKTVAEVEGRKITGKRTGKTLGIATHIPTGKTRYIQISVTEGEQYTSPKVENGNDFSIGLRADGNVWSWGTNTYGTLGRNDVSYLNVPEMVNLNEEKIEDISVGDNHVLVLTEKGEVYSFGLNNYGQLGRSGANNKANKVVGLNGKIIEDIVKVKAGRNVSYAIDSFGKVYVWGQGYYSNAREITLPKGLNGIIDITNSYLIDKEGKAYKYTISTAGAVISINELTELETEGTSNDDSGESAPKIISISEGYDHGVLVTEEGTVYGIGNNSFGQLGDGTTVSRTGNIVTQARIDAENILENVVEAYAGDRYTAILTKDGKLYTMGMNTSKEQGFEGEVLVRNAKENTKVSDLIGVTAGYGTTTVVKKDGTVWGFGQGGQGQLGNREERDTIDPIMAGEYFIQTNTNRVEVAEGESINLSAYVEYFNMVYSDIKEVEFEVKDTSIAGLDSLSEEEKAELEYNEFGVKLTGIKMGTTAVVVKQKDGEAKGIIQVEVIPEETTIKPQIATGNSHTIMLKVDGTVWTYGDNTYGQLGLGNRVGVDEPTQVQFPNGVEIVQIAAGDNHSVALDRNGNVYAWGKNDYYQLGRSGTYLSPVQMNNVGSKIVRIAAGSEITVMLTEKGEIYTSGINTNGEAGILSYGTRVTYGKASNMNNIIDIAAGKNHVIALRSDGTVYAVGSNLNGQLGVGSKNITKVNEYQKLGLNNIAYIEAEENSAAGITVDGEAYVWGSNQYGQLGTNDKEEKTSPELLTDINNIKEISLGKNHSTIRDGEGKIYATGSNVYGQHGDGANTNKTRYTKVETIEDIIDISSGETYTVVLKKTGQVYGYGDYNHGAIGKASKTKSNYPILVGNEQSTINVEEIVVRVGESKSITSNAKYAFNLIYIGTNNSSIFTYESLNNNKATINEQGMIQGQEIGTTWVKATEKDTGIENIAIVRVIDSNSNVAPKVEGGEDYAITLKADGTIWSYGYNGDGQLGLGTKNSSNIPVQSNIIATYKDISVGNNFTLALRQDGTVWAFGDNSKGQLGTKDIGSSSRLIQIEGLENIVAISAGENYGLALNAYGTVYGWGLNDNGQLGKERVNQITKLPTQLELDIGDIVSIEAGNGQTALINSKGEIYGLGKLFNGKLEGIENAFKAKVGKDYILVLKKDNTVEKYSQSGIELMCFRQDVIDIDVKDNVNMYQTIEGKVYTWGENSKGQLGQGNTEGLIFPKEVEIHGDNIFGIGAGYANTYVIANTGSVYASGENNYGQLGNGTNEDSNIYTLVGDRNFEVTPESKVLTVNDEEEIQISGNTFNVFSIKYKDLSEYEIRSSADEIVSYADGILTANSVGEARITITDKVTGQEEEILRVVQPINTDRIKVLTVDGVNANVSGLQEYTVKIPENGNIGKLNIQTKVSRDQISLDQGDWYTGTITTDIELLEKVTEIPFYIKVPNGTVLEYKLIVEKLSNENGIESILVDEIEAEKVDDTNYYIVIPEEKEQVQVIGTTVDENATISVDGIKNTEHISEATVKVPGIIKEVHINVTSESGRTKQYTLTIYKEVEENLLNITEVKVNGNVSQRVNDNEFYIEVADNVQTAEIIAKTLVPSTEVKIEDGEYVQYQVTGNKQLTSEKEEVRIRARYMDKEKEYILTIAKPGMIEQIKKQRLSLDTVKVNGQVASKVTSTLYYIEVENEVEEALIEATSRYGEVKIENTEFNEFTNSLNKGLEVKTTDVVITTRYGEDTKNYTLRIVRKDKDPVDLSLDRVLVNEITASKIGLVDYYISVANTADLLKIEAIAAGKEVKIESGEYVENTVTMEENFTTNIATYKIYVRNEGEEKEYTLTVVRQGTPEEGGDEGTTGGNEGTDPTKIPLRLEKLTVNNVDATYVEGSGNSYTYKLNEAIDSVNIFAKADRATTSVSINGESYTLEHATAEIPITSRYMTIPITLTEGNTSKTYYLTVEGLPDETGITNVTVDGESARYNYLTGRYEVRLNNNPEGYIVSAETVDSLAKIAIGETEGIGNIQEVVYSQGSTTIAEIKVVAQNGVTTATHRVAILEKSSDSSIEYITVNGKEARQEDDGNYAIEIDDTNTSGRIRVGTNSSYAIVNIAGENSNPRTIPLSEKETQVEIIVTSEDGTTQESKILTITRLSTEKGITVYVEDEQVQMDSRGIYYKKIARNNQTNLRIVANSNVAKISINGEEEKQEVAESVIATEEEVTNVDVKVTAENGTERAYTVQLVKKATNTNILEITSEGESGETSKAEIADDTTYDMAISDKIKDLKVRVTAEDSNAYVRIAETEEAQKSAQEVTLDVSETNSFKVEIIAEDGLTKKEYTVNLIKIHSIDIINVLVDDVETTRQGNSYEIVLEDYEPSKVKIIADNDDIPIELLKEGQVIARGIGVLETTIERTKRIENYTIISKSVDGEKQKEYSLTIKKRLSRNITVKVDEQEAEKVNEEEYRYFIERDKEQVHVSINAEEQTAILRCKEILDSEGNPIEGIQNLEFDVPITGEEVELTFEVEVADDDIKEYKLKILKYSNDNTLEYVKVNGKYAEKDEEGNFKIKVLDNVTEANIEAKTSNEFAYVRIDSDPESLHIVTGRYSLEQIRETMIPIIVRSQTEETEVRWLTIEKTSTNLDLETITADGKEAKYYESLGAYMVSVDGMNPKHEVYIKAKDEYTNIEYMGVTGQGTITTTVNLLSIDGYEETTIKVRAENGVEAEKKLILVNESNNAELLHLWVNDVELTPIDEEGLIYTADIKKLDGTAKVVAQSKHPYAEIAIGDFSSGIGTIGNFVELEEGVETITIPVKVTATDGVTIQTYNVILTRLSNNTRITKVQVNEHIAEQNEEGNYEVTLGAEEQEANVLIMAEDRNAMVTMGGQEEKGTLEEKVELDFTSKETVKTIKITAPDGTEEERKLIIRWEGRYTGKVKTESIEGVPQRATVIAYEVKKVENENGETEEIREKVEEVETKEDGSYELNLEVGRYEIVIHKDYYLEYKKTGLSLEGGEIIDLGEQQIYAGDVNEDGQIEISDLTGVTYNFGEVTEENGLGRYDLNEDGNVNEEDRNMVLKNYNMKDKTEEWIIPREVYRNRKLRRGEELTEDDMGDDLAYYIKTNGLFILPLELGEGETYKITSPYGTRKHPTTGEESKHTGIDIRASWHIGIRAVAEGEVVFAGDGGAFGNAVEIKHIINGEEIYTFYGHLSQIDVKVGDKVKQGERIGQEGGDASDDNPGNSTGHHLHFEVRKKSGYGNDDNPNYYLKF